MRGYFAFLVVFVSVFLLISLSQSLGANYSNFNKATDIAIEQNYQMQLNLKYSILEAGDQWTKKALFEYMLLHLGEPFDVNDMKEFVSNKAFEGIGKVAINIGKVYEADNYDIIVWCGYLNDNELAVLKKKMFAEKKALICEECQPIENEECKGFVNFDINAGTGQFSYLWLGANKPLDIFKKGVIGVSVYDKKFGVSGISYIPQNEKRSLT